MSKLTWRQLEAASVVAVCPQAVGEVAAVRCLVVYGTRPEAIKLAPVAKALAAAHHQVVVVNTGQHDSLMPSIMTLFGVRTDVELNVLRPNQSLTVLTARLLTQLDSMFGRLEPECVFVQGDTASALAGAMAAFYGGIPVAHVEAGLRTYRLYSPFPEETSRRIISTVATWNFCPSEEAAANLRVERVPGRIFVTGNPVVDALLTIVDKVRQPRPPRPLRIIATVHRRENIPHFDRIFVAFRRIAQQHDVEVIFPVHPNPAVKNAVRHWLADSAVRLIEPLDYLPWISLLSTAHLVITDSGGLQEEAPILGLPLLIVREATERPEVVSGGYGYLVGTDTETIVTYVNKVLRGELTFKQGSPYGDGRAAERIAGVLERDAGGVESAAAQAKDLL
jgi:UDP-N-acetylglucosamine 2-epimerase (non-hydrolysing)